MDKKAIRIGLVILMFSFASLPLAVAARGPVKQDQSLRRGETRATLNPDTFRDVKIVAAYRIAKEIPTVLDSIYCHCQCEESPAFRHKSLLSCYVDNHAAM